MAFEKDFGYIDGWDTVIGGAGDVIDGNPGFGWPLIPAPSGGDWD